MLKPEIRALASQIDSPLETSDTSSGVEAHKSTTGTRNHRPRRDVFPTTRYASTRASRRAPLSWKMASSSCVEMPARSPARRMARTIS